MNLIEELFDIKNKIEEKRLIYGQKLEKFLVAKLIFCFNYFKEIFLKKSTAFYGCAFIFLLSVYLCSSRDLGQDSGVYLDIAKKILDGKKYYYDFFEYNFPLAFIFTLVPEICARIFRWNSIVSLEVFIFLIGVSSLFFCSKILSKTKLVDNQSSINLLLICFACAFFLRTITLEFKEIATKSSYFLSLIFPYFCYQIPPKTKFKKSDEIICGVLAGLMICLKPNYGIIVFIFELEKFFRTPKLKTVFCLRNYSSLIVLILYSLIIWKFFFEFFDKFFVIQKMYFVFMTEENFHLLNKFNEFLVEHFIKIFVFTALTFFVIKQDFFLKKLLLLSFSSGLLILSEIGNYLDQKHIFYGLSLPLITFTTIALFQKQKNEIEIKFKKYFLLILAIFVVGVADFKFFESCWYLSICFWFVLIIFSAHNLQSFSKSIDNKHKKKNQLRAFYCVFTILFLLSILLFAYFSEWFVIVGSSALILYLIFSQKLYENYSEKSFSVVSVFYIFLVVANFFALHFYSIFLINNSDSTIEALRSQKNVNKEIVKNYKTFGANGDEILIFGYGFDTHQPVLSYLELTNKTPFNEESWVQLFLFKKKIDLSYYEKFFLERIAQELQNPRNKFLFFYQQGKCEISILEYLLRFKEIKKLFKKNYHFLNYYIDYKIIDKPVQFFAQESLSEDEKLALQMQNHGQNQEQNENSENKISRIGRRFEVYVRK